MRDENYFNPGYDLTVLRLNPAEQFYSWPESPKHWKQLDCLLETDETTGITYSRGVEWHQNISPHKNGALPNCYYRVNSDNAHWYEYEHNPDVVALGCSLTAGMGIPIEYTWPSIYRQITGETVNNIGRPGNPLARSAYSLFRHVKNYGPPKKIFVLLGDPYRYWHQGPLPRPLPHEGPGLLLNDRIVQFNHDTLTYVGHGGKPWNFRDSLGRETMLSPDICVGENLRAFEHVLYFAEAFDIDVKLQVIQPIVESHFEQIGYPVVRSTANQEPVPETKDQELFWRYGFDFVDGVHHDAHPGLVEHLKWVSGFLGRPVTQNELKTITCWASHLFDHDAPKWSGKER